MFKNGHLVSQGHCERSIKEYLSVLLFHQFFLNACLVYIGSCFPQEALILNLWQYSFKILRLLSYCRLTENWK